MGNLYIGCMKSGEVLTDKRWKWFEPEHWRFGDPAGGDGKINYMRHASGERGGGWSRPWTPQPGVGWGGWVGVRGADVAGAGGAWGWVGLG